MAHCPNGVVPARRGWTRCKRFAGWTVAAFLGYTILGFLLLPPVVRSVAEKELSKQLNRPVTIQKVRLNPYRFSAAIRGLLVKDKDGAPLVSWDQAEINFQARSLFSHAWVFKEVSLSNPLVRVRVNQDYTLNFSDIVARLAPATPSKATAAAPRRAWRIDRLRLSGGRVYFTDLTPRVAFQQTIGPLEMTLLDFRTDKDHQNRYAFSGITDGGERFSWKGFFAFNPLRSAGEFFHEGVSLTNYAPLYQDLFRFEIKDGVIDLHSTYRYERSAATHLLAVTNTTFSLESLKVVEKDTGQTVAEAAKVVVTGGSVDAMARQAEAGMVTVDGGRFRLRRNQDTSVNAIELVKPAAAAPNAPGGIVLLLRAMTNVVAMLLNSTNLSNGTVREFNLTNCTLRLEDLANARPVRVNLEGIALHARNLSNRAGTNMTAELSLRWDTNGTIRAGFQAGLSPPGAEAALAFDAVDLVPLAPYLDPYLDALMLGGKLNLAGTVRWRGARDELPEIRFQGDAALDGFSLAGSTATEPLLRWNSLRLSGIEASLNPPVISVPNATLEEAFAQWIIETNRTINLLSAWRQGGASAAPPPPTNATAVRPSVSLGRLAISNASVHFIDRSLQPSVNITLAELSGTLAGLSSADPRQAGIHLQGTVDKTARAGIAGTINPWNPRQAMDLTLSLEAMNLLPEDPYSGKYLGYRLLNGKLSAQLRYQIAERQLKSENRLTLDQFALGEKVESSHATSLPVRLAIAILKDRNGRITLDLPVNGSLNDPQFSLGKVVLHTIGSLVTKIVTSPFSSLVALFGGKGEELSFQEFLPGSTNLLPAAMANLDVLAKGLYERPELRLEIEGSADPLIDLAALRRAKLPQRSLEPSGETAVTLLPAGTNAASPESLPARSARIAPSLKKGATALRGAPAHWSLEPQSTASASPSPQGPAETFASAKGATALLAIPSPPGGTESDAEAQLLETVELPPNALQTLAAQRALNVKAYLVQTGKVEAQRIAELAQSASGKGSRVYLRLR